MIARLFVAGAAALFATAGQAATIDFEAQKIDDFGYQSYGFTEDGFRVTLAPTSIFGMYLINDPAKNVGMCGPGCASNGTTAYYGLNETSVSISRAENDLFSLTSIDAAQTFLGLDRPLSLTLTGVQAGKTIKTSVYVDPMAAEHFLTFSFANFVNLSSLTISGGRDFPEFALDNVVLSTSAVPEPASWAMMIGGFAVVGGAMRRVRSVKTKANYV
jgi:hypothetical protein